MGHRVLDSLSSPVEPVAMPVCDITGERQSMLFCESLR
jgi:hypothetical protein